MGSNCEATDTNTKNALKHWMNSYHLLPEFFFERGEVKAFHQLTELLVRKNRAAETAEIYQEHALNSRIKLL